MNALVAALERASGFGLAALCFALVAQWALDKRVPAAWRVWLWRAALLQTAGALVPLTPLPLALLPARSSMAMPVRAEKSAPRNVPLERQNEMKSAPRIAAPPRFSAPPFVPAPDFSSPSARPVFRGDGAARATAPLARPVSPQLRLPQLPLAKSAPHLNWRAVVFTFYALGIAFQMLRLTHSLRRLRRHLRLCQPLENAAISVQLREIARRMRVKTSPLLLKSVSGAPFLTGFYRPAIVLPASLLAAPNPDLDAVLCHELAHLQRRDLAWNALMRGVQLVFWFHPLSWVARRFLALETESACDEMVLSSLRIAPAAYGALLLNTMNTPKTSSTASHAVGLTDDFSALQTRLLRLNQAPKQPRRASKIAFATACLMGFGAIVPLRLVARAQGATVTSDPQLKRRQSQPQSAPSNRSRTISKPAISRISSSKLPAKLPLSLPQAAQSPVQRASIGRVDAFPIPKNRALRPGLLAFSSMVPPVVAAPALSFSNQQRAVSSGGKTTLPPNEVRAPAETGVIDIARQRNLNVLIDSTDIDPLAATHENDPRTCGPQGDALNAILSFGAQFRLSADQTEAKTLLFWAEPDQEKIVQAVFRGEGLGADQSSLAPDEAVLAFRQALDPEGLRQERAAQATSHVIFQNADAEPPVRPDAPLAAKLSELPLDLQKVLVASLQSRFGNNELPQDYGELWTHDEVWRRARVYLRPGISAKNLKNRQMFIAQMQKEGKVQNVVTTDPSDEPSLEVQVEIQDGTRRVVLSNYPIGGFGAQLVPPTKGAAPIAPRPDLAADKLLVLDAGGGQDATLNETLPPAGSALAALLKDNAANLDLSADALQTPISLEATRQPLSETLTRAAAGTPVTLSLGAEMLAQAPLLSMHVEKLPLSEMMQAVAHLYGARWLKTEPNTFTLVSRDLSALEMQLLRVGKFGWYRFRDNNVAQSQDHRQEFRQFQDRVVKEGGSALSHQPENGVGLPGIAFTALPLATQQELRQRAMAGMMRSVVEHQIEARRGLHGEWSFAWQNPSLPSTGNQNANRVTSTVVWNRSVFSVLIDGKRANSITKLGAPTITIKLPKTGGNFNVALEGQYPKTP